MWKLLDVLCCPIDELEISSTGQIYWTFDTTDMTEIQIFCVPCY